MIAYKKTNGRAHDIRFVAEDYVAEPGEFLVVGDVLPSRDALSDPPSVATLKAEKLTEINAAFEAAAAQVTAGYPPSEKITWPTQEREALAWNADNTAPTPYIDALASARGITRVDYLNRTMTKITAFRASSATLVGKRQRYEDQAKAAELAGDAATIRAIAPDFSLP